MKKQFRYKIEGKQNPYIGFTDFQHFGNGKLYSDLIVKPEMLCEAAKYIETGEYESANEFVGIDLSEHETMTSKTKKVIKSSSNARERFNKENEKKFKKEKKSAT